ncbi:procathepsin L-like [Dreissena polymorpha]|uniref:Cathepsin L n=1 Tax=Dreissena polymorpha TaxID=45954 RepID=A0A9D4CVS1_DREPO|nr:procathepsin L-like [Dreissena polymorpha]KAH3734401.1 hypothetical protein DPMN_040841 [Dreissena polymorpha]
MVLLLATLLFLAMAAHSFPNVVSYDGVIQIGAYNMSLPTDKLFQLFKDKTERKYKRFAEEEKRRQIFADNVRYINKHNAKYASGESTFYLGINQFTDMSYQEFAENYANLQNEDTWKGNASIFVPPENYATPSSVDWRQKGYVTQVKDQGPCGSGWAFSATGAIEGQFARQTGTLVSLSEQQLIDCSSRSYGNYGCRGGSPGGTFQYVRDQEGIESEPDYPYRAMPFPCSFTKSKVRATVREYFIVKPDEKSLETATASVGPISASIKVNRKFQLYKGGVFNDCSGELSRDHAVLVVGYTSIPNAWLVKNSYSSNWGEEGYITMRKGWDVCDIASKAVFPRV